VDSPVTVSAGDGVLGAVSMVNEEGEPVAGQLSPDGLTWATAEPLGYNKQYTLTAEALGLGGVVSNRMTFETQSPENLTMPCEDARSRSRRPEQHHRRERDA
jgi:hypothetical protein